MRDSQSQVILSQVSNILEEGGNVPVMIVHEHDNLYDSKTIAFKCQLDDKWHRIGYIVRECLDHVHKAKAGNKIASVEFSWVKYVGHAMDQDIMQVLISLFKENGPFVVPVPVELTNSTAEVSQLELFPQQNLMTLYYCECIPYKHL